MKNEKASARPRRRAQEEGPGGGPAWAQARVAVSSQPRTAVFPHQKGETKCDAEGFSFFFFSSEDVFALLPTGFLPRDGDKHSAGIEAPRRGQRREPDVSLFAAAAEVPLRKCLMGQSKFGSVFS